MSIYYNAQGETREIDDALYAAWVAAGNPKAAQWTLRPDPPVYDPATHSVAWDGAQWVVSALPPPPVPEEVDALAFELTLHGMGLHASVMGYIGTLNEIEQIHWRRRNTMRRDSALIESGRVALGLTVAQVDALFVAAGQVVT